MSETEHLSQSLADLDLRLGNTTGMAAAFEAELARLGETVVYSGREVARLSTSFSGSLRRAFDGLAFDGVKAADAVRGLGQSLAANLYATATKPIFDTAGGVLAQAVAGLSGGLAAGVLPFAKGAAFQGGRVTPFAKGGVVASATTFPMRGGVGLMGEAGPEAIMPLARGADGRLGVVAGGARGGSPQIVMHISTPDVGGFRRSEAQIAAQMARALAQGQRNR